MSNPTNKTYIMKLVSDMLEIPADRFDDFLIQLKKWHDVGRDFTDFLRVTHEVLGEKMPKEFMTIKWKDDGIEEGMPTINVGAAPSEEGKDNE